MHGKTREEALARMRVALSEVLVEGISTNITLHKQILADSEFNKGWHEHSLSGKAPRRMDVDAQGDRTCCVRSIFSVMKKAPKTSAICSLDAGAMSVTIEDADRDKPDEVPLYGEPGLEPRRLPGAARA